MKKLVILAERRLSGRPLRAANPIVGYYRGPGSSELRDA